MSKIELKHIDKFYGKNHILKDVNLTIEDGDFMTLLGPSGCGKTTTLRVVSGLEKPQNGTIHMDGKEIVNAAEAHFAPPSERGLNLVFQSYALWPHMTVRDNIAFGLNIKKLPKEEVERRVTDSLERMQISQYIDRYPSELSGGQQQRVAIARAIASEPRLLLLDEPLSNLDAKLRLEMRSELQRLHIDTGSTFIYVTHDQMEAMTLATKICLIDNGVLQQYDAPLDVYNKPNNLFVADFVGNPAINFMEAKGHQAPDGTVELEVFAGTRLAFTPRTPLDLPDWFARADAQDAEKKAAEQAKQSQKGHVEKGNKDTPFRCHIAKVNETEDFGDEAVLSDEDFVLGVRPEFLSISEHGALEAEVYSAMPTGMETTVKLRIGEYLLTGVIFGGVLYQIGQKVRVDFEGDHMVLFSRKNGRIITQGSLSVRSAR